MGGCQCKVRKRKPSTNATNFNTSNENDLTSRVNINLRRNSGIFVHPSCPIDNENIEAVQKELEQFGLPQGEIVGEYIPVWKRVFLDPKCQFWYNGEWRNGKRYGKGSLYNSTEELLITGLFVDNIIDRKLCRKIYQNGSYYIGEVNQFYEAEGQGQMHYKDGSKYVGSFFGGIPNGTGKEIKLNSQFEGKFKNGIKKYGTLNDDRGKYEGEFEDNMKHGYGKIQTKTGALIAGHFTHNKLSTRITASDFDPLRASMNPDQQRRKRRSPLK